MKCFDKINPSGGFGMSHNGRCFRGIVAPEVHGKATHHVRSGSACANYCTSCTDEFSKRKDKTETEITEL